MEKIGIKKLNDVNYSDWKFEVELLLVREQLWKFVDPGVRPDGDAAAATWDEGDKRARATIGLLVEPTQYSLVKPTKTAKEAWDSIQKAHEKKGRTSKTMILRSVMRMEYVDGEDIGAYICRMEDSFEKLEIAGQKLDKDLKVNLVLSSLPDSFGTLITSLEGRQDEELTMEFIRGKLVDEVCRRNRTGGSDRGSESALKLEFKSKGVVCYFCGNPGHKRKDCRLWMMQRKPEAQQYAGQEEHCQNAKAAEDCTKFAFSVKTGSRAVSEWILDSGASSHMCWDRSKFESIDTSYVVDVALADGQKARTKGIGTCKLEIVDKNGRKRVLKLSGTLFMPELSVNLLSVLKLTRKGATVVFKDKGCLIKRNRLVVATAGIRNGLYYVQGDETLQNPGQAFGYIAAPDVGEAIEEEDVEGVMVADSDDTQEEDSVAKCEVGRRNQQSPRKTLRERGVLLKRREERAVSARLARLDNRKGLDFTLRRSVEGSNMK